MLKIRLSRTGKNSQPSFRVVLQEHTAAAKGKYIEAFGYYLPAQKPKKLEVDVDKIKQWISKGAQPSDTVAALLKNQGVEGMDKFMAPRNKKRKNKKAGDAPAAAPVAAAAPAPAPVEAPAPTPEAPAPEAAPAETPAETPAEVPATETPKEETPQ